MGITTFIKLFDWFFDHAIIFINSGTLALANILAKKNHYQPLIETRYQQILNEIFSISQMGLLLLQKAY